jgi:hypothetical protein
MNRDGRYRARGGSTDRRGEIDDKWLYFSEDSPIKKLFFFWSSFEKVC